MKLLLLFLFVSVATCEEPELWLFRRSNIDDHQVFTTENPDLSNMDPSIPTWFIIHGYNSNSSWDVPNAKVILNEKDSNVILVNWPKEALTLYPIACYRMLTLARRLAGFIDLLKLNGFDDANMKVVGFSLGAHFAGVTCKSVKDGFNGVLIGLDAPSVPFNSFNETDKITATDAAYVEFYHAAGAVFAIIPPVGQRDYYINGGMYQPGCDLTVDNIICSHMKAHEVYGKLLAGVPLEAKECNSAEEAIQDMCKGDYAVMPRETAIQKKSPGIYYLKHL